MRLFLHIGPERERSETLHSTLQNMRETLGAQGVLVPSDPEGSLARRILMAVTDPDHIVPARFDTGCLTSKDQATVREGLIADLEHQIATHRPDTLILMAGLLGSSLHRESERELLRALLECLSEDIRIIAQVDNPAAMLARQYGWQVMHGRATPLSRDLALGTEPDWWHGCLAAMPPIAPEVGRFEEIDGPPFWLDSAAFGRFWEAGFGPASVRLHKRSVDERSLAEALSTCFELGPLPDIDARPDDPIAPSAAWITRARRFNGLIQTLLATGKRKVPHALWHDLLAEIRVDGPPIDPDSLRNALSSLSGCRAGTEVDEPTARWTEADPKFGFRASQYLLAFMYRIDKATKAALKGDPERRRARPLSPSADQGLSPGAQAMLPHEAKVNFAKLQRSPLAPHDGIGSISEDAAHTAYTPAPAHTCPTGSTGRVIVACMKNEAPYIVEWIAHHRAIGIDGFLIYTNDCSDGTADLLVRLQEMGVVQHRSNDAWKGRSPQQHALNKAIKEPIVRQAEWIVHIDVDEFINVRTGNGTLDDFFHRVPDATNVAMTWRLFGHNGVTGISDGLVIEQFDTCAPKYCPKPHTAWGFKTMFRNLGAYGKISCHRPNKLDASLRDRVKWVNGSGEDMTSEVIDNGWRNSRKSIGYDLLQLNHYALRSADGFLVKRQRGRALHVDRAIGLNYWIRMDWSDVRDVTIQRNISRVRDEMDRLLSDPELDRLHRAGFAWHRAKAAELREVEEFRTLYDEAVRIRLTGTERVAYALALDVDS